MSDTPPRPVTKQMTAMHVLPGIARRIPARSWSRAMAWVRYPQIAGEQHVRPVRRRYHDRGAAGGCS